MISADEEDGFAHLPGTVRGREGANFADLRTVCVATITCYDLAFWLGGSGF